MVVGIIFWKKKMEIEMNGISGGARFARGFVIWNERDLRGCSFCAWVGKLKWAGSPGVLVLHAGGKIEMNGISGGARFELMLGNWRAAYLVAYGTLMSVSFAQGKFGEEEFAQAKVAQEKFAI